MFDPYDYFDIRHNRAVCPVHGEKDRNLEIKRHKTQDKWVFNCYSHNCTIRQIAEAAGFPPGAIYDHKSDPDWRPPVTTKTMGLRQLVKQAKTKPIADRVEETFGPNPCTTLRLQTDEGDLLELACDGKRCIHCGQRKAMLLSEQNRAIFGENVYVERIEAGRSLTDVDRGIQRAKKEFQRGGSKTSYVIVGDNTLGRIVLSNQPLTDKARRMKLSDWTKRVADLYHHSAARIRRTLDIGRMSLVPYKRRKANGGQPSPWSRINHRTQAIQERADQVTQVWAEMLADTQLSEMKHVLFPG